MSMENRISTGEAAETEKHMVKGYELFDEAALIGKSIRALNDYHISDDSKYETLAYELASRASNFYQLEFTYSGSGFIPARLPNHQEVTIYGEVKYGKGFIKDFVLKKPVDFDFLAPDEYDPYDFEFDHISNELIEKFASQLKHPPEGTGLYGKFLIKNYVSDDRELFGSCVVGDLVAYQYVDMSRFELVDITDHSDSEVEDPEDLPDLLEHYTQNYREEIREQSFRNLSADQQKFFMDEYLSKLNRSLLISRFMFAAGRIRAYTPVVEDGQRKFEPIKTECDIEADCIKLDCLESQIIAEGIPMRKRRGNVNSSDGLSLVAELNERDASKHGLDSNIIWIPLHNQVSKIIFELKPAF